MLVVRPGHVPQNQSTKILQHVLYIPVLFPPLTPDLPLPSFPHSDVKLICQLSSKLYILAHRFQLFRTSLPHYLNLCFQPKKHYFFPLHDTCTFRTDCGLLFVEEVSKLQTEQFIRFVSPLPYNL